MSFDILESLNSVLGGPITRQLSSSLDETEDSTRSAVRSIGPTMLAGLMHQATTPTGAADMFRAVNDERIDTGIVGKLGSLLGNRGSVDSMRGLGESLAGMVFGSRGGAVSNAISQVTGVRPNSASSLLSLGLPILFGILRKQVGSGGLDVSGFTSLLSSQRGALERSGLDSRITGALGFGSLSNLLSAFPGASTGASRGHERVPDREATPIYRARPESRRRWLPWAIAAGLAVVAVMWMMNRTDQRGAERTAAQITPEPTGERTRLATATTRVYFGSDEAAIDDEDRRKIASVAESAKGEGRAVTITGYADSSGDADQNQALAKDRATAVKDALVAEGVAESRIVLDPPAAVTGLGTDAEARRVDVKVQEQ